MFILVQRSLTYGSPEGQERTFLSLSDLDYLLCCVYDLRTDVPKNKSIHQQFKECFKTRKNVFFAETNNLLLNVSQMKKIIKAKLCSSGD